MDDDRGMATKAAKWLFKQNLCNGSAVVSPFPVYHQSPDLSGRLSSRARRRIGRRGEEKVIGILGAENHEERRQIRAFLDQQYVRERDDGTDIDESSEFDRLESRASPNHVSSSPAPQVPVRGRGPAAAARGGGDGRTRFAAPQEVVSTSTSGGSKVRFRGAVNYDRTPPQSPTTAGYSSPPGRRLQHHLDRERERDRGIYHGRRQADQERSAKIHANNGSHLPPILWPRSSPLHLSNQNHHQQQRHQHQHHFQQQQQQQQMHRYVEYPGATRDMFVSYNAPSPQAAGLDEIFAKAWAYQAQSPPRRSFTRPPKLSATFALSEPQSPYLSPRMSPYPTFSSSPRPAVSISEKLGCGSYSVVYRGEYLGQQVAVKVLHDDERISAKEVSVLSRLDHQNIVKYIGTTTLRDGRFGILLELMKGSLASDLKDSNGLDESVVRIYTRQILQGLEYLHRMKILHRDIKCGNILLDSSGNAKLADFGLAKKIDQSCAKSYKGTLFYMAPEVLLTEGLGHHYGLAADVWSLGCTVIEMACGKPPWSGFGMMPFYEKMREGQIPAIPEKLSADGVDFVRRCLTREPRRRPSAAALLNHPFLLAAFSDRLKGVAAAVPRV